MNKKLKTLLLVSALSLSVSACAGKWHGKNASGDYEQKKMSCKMTKSMEKAQKNADNVLKALDEAAANAKDEATKKRLGKIIKDADKLSNEIGKCRRMCDANAEKSAAKSDTNAVKSSKHHAKKAAGNAAPSAAAHPAK